MIHPTQLTKAAGFEEGVVIEIGYKPWKDQSQETVLEYGKLCKIWPDSVETEQEESPYGLDWIVCIRPLTGPMAIWNFAPEWATCCQNREMGISWDHQIPEWWDGKSTVIQLRPWWAK